MTTQQDYLSQLHSIQKQEQDEFTMTNSVNHFTRELGKSTSPEALNKGVNDIGLGAYKLAVAGPEFIANSNTPNLGIGGTVSLVIGFILIITLSNYIVDKFVKCIKWAFGKN